jgi:hypothetical protein
MSIDAWLSLQGQLWHAYGPLVSWWLAFLLAGMVAAVCLTFAMVFFSEWLG